MPSIASIYQADLRALLGDLNQQLQGIADELIGQQPWPIYVQDVPSASARIHLCEHVMQLEYDNDQMKPGETVSYQGVCGTTPHVLSLIKTSNELRAILATLLRAMDKEGVDTGAGRVKLSQYALKKLGYPRFNRRQAIRRLNVFDHPLNTLSFFWARQRKINKTSVQQVQTEIEKKLKKASEDFSYYLKADLEHLANIPRDEPLYYVFQKNDHPRANYVLDTPDGKKRGSAMASSPFFYPANAQDPLPRVRDLPNLEQRAPRLARTDKTINDTPFLPSVHVHRLRN